MTNVFKRIQYTLEAELHNLLDKKQANNPVGMLNQYVREAEKQTKQTAALLKRQASLKMEVEQQLVATSDMLTKREAQLHLASGSGDEALIAFAEQEVKLYTNRLQEINRTLAEVTEDYYELEQQFELMKHKIEDMKIRQLSLMGKENKVRAQHEMNRTMQQVQVPDYDEVEQYIQQLGTNSTDHSPLSTLEQRLDELTKNK